MKTKEQIAVEETMVAIYNKALPFNTPETGIQRWTLEDFITSPNGKKMANALASLFDPTFCDTPYEDF